MMRNNSEAVFCILQVIGLRSKKNGSTASISLQFVYKLKLTNLHNPGIIALTLCPGISRYHVTTILCSDKCVGLVIVNGSMPVGACFSFISIAVHLQQPSAKIIVGTIYITVSAIGIANG